MIAGIRKSMQEKDKGFTLIELLVVIIIIGILAAIAIPVFLNQRKKGWDAAVQSDLKNAATTQETYLTENGAYSAETPVDATAAGDLGELGFKYSAAGNYDATAGQTINVIADAGNSFCIDALSASGETWVYDNSAGGLQPKGTAACV